MNADGTITSASSAEALVTGAVLGRYVILSRLGEGGMGVVYAAYDPELDRKIALKLLRDMGDPAGFEQARARMLREAQAMARLSHPNVITVHDVGLVNGRIFIAMEFVEGVTLRAWLEAEKRSLAAIIAIFTQAGRGLAAAHAQGIVHRDFKPDNVLIDRDNRARVLDFGLAHGDASANAAPIFDRASMSTTGNELPRISINSGQLRELSNALDTKLTQAGVVIGTPAYMSAEQFTGKPTDARSDQFSFCAALYEALYGELPYVGENIKELARAVYHGEMRPEPAGKGIPKRIRQALIRGLGPKKEGRFASMNELLAAIQIEPARHVSTWAILATTLVVTAVGLGVFLKSREDPGAVCRTSKDKLAGIWDKERKRIISEAFLATKKPYAQDAFTGVERALDDYSEKWVNMRTDACLATRVRGEQSPELFDLRMACLNHKLTEVKAFTDVLAKGGSSTVEKSVSASQSLAGIEVCANAEALRAVVPPPKDEATQAKVQKLREIVAEVNALGLAGRYKDQLPLAEQAAADVGQIKYRPIEAEVFLALANTRHVNGAPKEAETLILNAIFAAEAGRHDELAFKAWLLFARWQSALEGHEIEQARQSASHAGALLERMGGNALLQADLDATWGHVEYEGGNYEKARERYDAALIGYEKLRGPEHHSVARLIENIASVARHQGRHEEALSKSRRALTLLEKALGPHHPWVSGALTAIGIALESRGEFVEAQKVHERALEINEKSYGPDHNNTAVALMNLANVLGENGKPDEAIAMYTRALGIQEKQYGVGHAKTANILMNIGATLTQVNRHEESVPYFERSLAIQEKSKGPDYIELCVPLSNLGGALVVLRRLDEAMEPFQRALNLARKVHGDKHPYIADALVGIGTLYNEKRQSLQAIPLLEEAMTMRISLDEDPVLVAEAKYQLGRAYWDSARNKLRAIGLVKEAQKVHQNNPARDKRNAVEIDAWLRKNAAH